MRTYHVSYHYQRGDMGEDTGFADAFVTIEGPPGQVSNLPLRSHVADMRRQLVRLFGMGDSPIVVILGWNEVAD
jgi:hypothetical protein